MWQLAVSCRGVMDNCIAAVQLEWDGAVGSRVVASPGLSAGDRIAAAPQWVVPTLEALRFWLAATARPLWDSLGGAARAATAGRAPSLFSKERPEAGRTEAACELLALRAVCCHLAVPFRELWQQGWPGVAAGGRVGLPRLHSLLLQLLRMQVREQARLCL